MTQETSPNSILKPLLIIFLLSIGGVRFLLWMGSETDEQFAERRTEEMRARQQSEYPMPNSEPPDPKDKMKMVRITWHKGGFDTVALITFTIENGNPHGVSDIQVTCEFSGNSGTTLNTRTETIYERIPAEERKTFRDLNFGFVHQQASSASCKIVSVK